MKDYMFLLLLKFLLSLSIIILFFSKSAYAQVNIEAMRNLDLKDGFNIGSALNLQFAKGNSDFFYYAGQIRFDYKKKMNNCFFIADLKQGELEDNKFINKGVMHYRFIRSFSEIIATEIFSQLEYDDFVKLKRRKLLGTGLRFRPIEKKGSYLLHLGIGIMREHEKYSDAIEKKKNLWRSTNYLTGTFAINQKVALSLTCYYQVVLENFSDYRILFNSGLSTNLFSRFSLITFFEFRFDNEPLSGVLRYDLNLLNGISFSF